MNLYPRLQVLEQMNRFVFISVAFVRIFSGVGLPALFLAGCASPNPQPAFAEVQETVRDRLGQQVLWQRDEAAGREIAQAVAAQLQAGLTAQSAVAIALVNNRSLQAEFEEIGISQAALAQASRLKNPGFTGSWRLPDRPPSAVDMEYSVAFDFLDLLALPARTKIAAQEVTQAKLKVADEVLQLAREVQATFYTVQARQLLVTEEESALAINDAAADIAQRQHAAGNINDLALLTQQAAKAQSQLALARAKVEVLAGREKLNRLLGLADRQTAWEITGNLPALPDKDPSADNLEAVAIKQRLDLAAAYVEVQKLALVLHLKENTRWVPGLTLGVDTERQTDSQIITGPFIGVELPLFDQGQPELAKLGALYRQAERRYEGLAVDIRSEVRDAVTALYAAREVVIFYQNVVLPQRRQIVRETQLQYNAMQLSNYVLLAARENEQTAQQGYIEALRDYWIARAELDRTVGGRLGEAPSAQPTSVAQANATASSHL